MTEKKDSIENAQESSFVKTIIGKPKQWLIDAAASIGLDYSSLTHETTTDLFFHSMKRHGDPKKHGRATVSNTDFEQIVDIIKNPDYAVVGAMRKTALFNIHVKIYHGITFFYFEEVLKSRKNKALRGKTFYKVTRPLTLDEIINNVTKNNKTDISKAKVLNNNVQTAGGNPGGKAET